MPLKPHNDFIKDGYKNKGYAIRVGDQVPANSANLAYVRSKAVSPEENILLEDVSGEIRENGLAAFIEKDVLVYPGESYLLETEAGQFTFPTEMVSVTDEFTVPENRQDHPQPVFYEMHLSGLFDVRNADVLPYRGGYATETKQEAIPYQEVSPDKREELLYVGDSIRIERNGTTIAASDVFKVVLAQEDQFLYRVKLYTNFRNKENLTYRVSYPAYDANWKRSETKEEVLNANPFFERITLDQFEEDVQAMEANPDAFKHLKAYAVKQVGQNFEIYATSDVMVANLQTRNPQTFRHRVEAKLKTKLSETNKGKLNIGFYVVQQAINVENLLSIGKDLNEQLKLPAYLELDNPHRPSLGLLKRDMDYWMIDPHMPTHHYEDYDVIVITGYGKVDLSVFKQKFEHFLKNGGTLWVDNAGIGINVLDFTTSRGNSFLYDIGFSSSTNEFGILERTGDSPLLNRLYPIQDMARIAYAETAPMILFGQNEESYLWNSVLQHLNGGPALMEKEVFGRGTVRVTNGGIFRGSYHHQEESIHLILNALLHQAEEKWFMTPWRNEFVYHRDNLFAQEYRFNNTDIYINDRNDYNANEIVAKKMLAPNMGAYVKDFVEPWFYNAKGYFEHHIDGSKEVAVANSGFESGRVTEAGEPVTTWTSNTTAAIPGWNTKKLAGQTVSFQHLANDSAFGVRQILIDSTNPTVGAQAFWESDPIFLSPDEYEISAWMQTEQVAGITTEGAKIGVFSLSGAAIETSIHLFSQNDWTKVTINFQMEWPQEVYIRLGFVDGNGYGKVWFDQLSMQSLGTVRGVASNEGQYPVYAFSTKPNASTIDIEAEGFQTADITRATPEVAFSYTISPFIYEKTSLGFDEVTGFERVKYDRFYAQGVSYKETVRKTDGLLTLGYLHTLLPEIPAGRQWYDKNKVFYRIHAGSALERENQLVNLRLFDRKSGMEWYQADELVISHLDLFGATDKPGFVLHAETGYETIRASKRNFGLKLLNEQRIYPKLPETKDAKENWYLRIHNGRFSKLDLGYKEWMGLYANDKPGLMEKYQERVMRNEDYSIPEYRKQIFNPSIGIKTVENEVEYLTPNTLKVPHGQLYTEQGTVYEELIVEGYSTTTGTLFRSRHTDWVRTEETKVFIDLEGDGNPIEIFESFPYEINYEEGTIFFPGRNITGNVFASFTYRNFRVYKRIFRNGRISDDPLTGKIKDKRTNEYVMYGRKENWMVQPIPILKVAKGKGTKDTLIPATNYRIDHEKGAVIFSYEPQGTVYADYSYFENEELKVKDFDRENGILFLEKPVSFKDDLFAKYSYFDNYYDYNGFFHEGLNKFLHLDLNPSAGHYSTLPVTTFVGGTETVEYRNAPSSKLMNKAIHIYLVPESEEGSAIRHCFSAEEWRVVQRSNPMYLLIAKVQVREHTTVNDLVVMDARTRGGGITERLSTKQIDERVKGRQRYWDIGNWDGKAFYRNGVLIIQLPKSILVEYGGNLLEEYAREAIDKHVAYGTYFIIEWE